MSKLPIILNALEEMRKNNFVDTFSESPKTLIMKALDEDMSGNFWVYACCGRDSDLLNEYFDGDTDAFSSYKEYCKYSAKMGFQMPAWGVD